MRYYIEIKLRPTVDIGPYVIMGKVISRIHLGFVNQKEYRGVVPVGVSFPQYDSKRNHLGHVLRLFAAEKEILEEMDVPRNLKLDDYVDVSDIEAVPGNIKSYAKYSRIQPKNNNARLARRKAKRHGISFEQAMDRLRHRPEKEHKMPYVNIKSRSTGHWFPLFISKQSAFSQINDGYSSFGLSVISTVPEF